MSMTLSSVHWFVYQAIQKLLIWEHMTDMPESQLNHKCIGSHSSSIIQSTMHVLNQFPYEGQKSKIKSRYEPLLYFIPYQLFEAFLPISTLPPKVIVLVVSSPVLILIPKQKREWTAVIQLYMKDMVMPLKPNNN